MSRVGKLPVPLPKGVDATIAAEHTRFFDLYGDLLTVMPVFAPRGKNGGLLKNCAFVFERMKG